jgi:hypothetical protein
LSWHYKPLQFGTCMSCGKQISPGESGWHNYEIHKVRCTICGSPDEVTPEVASEDISKTTTTDPVGGSAALREARRQKDANWRKGAIGEYLTDRFLFKNLAQKSIILNDRELPGTKANIDHIVVAPSGIWIIDSKYWEGKIAYKPDKLLGMNTRLFVGGEDRTSKVEAIYDMVIPVAQIIGDRSVVINPAVVFTWGNWNLPAYFRLLVNKPYKHVGVWITAPRALVKLINRAGPLDPMAIADLGRKLDEALKPR